MSRNRARRMIQRPKAQIGEGDCIGAYCWWDLGESIRVERSTLIRAFVDADLPDKFMPPEIKPEGAFAKAVRSANRRARSGYMLRPIKTVQAALYNMYGLIREDNQEDLAYDANVARIGFNKATHRIEVFSGAGEPEVDDITQTFHDYSDVHITVDIRRTLTRNLVEFLGAMSVRKSGGVYFVAAPYLPELRAHKKVLEGCCNSALDITPLHQPGDLSRTARGSLESDLRALEGEVQSWLATDADTPRSDTLERRLEEFTALKDKLALYSDILSFRSEDLQQKLIDLDATVCRIIAGGSDA